MCPPGCSIIFAPSNIAAIASDFSRDTRGSFWPTTCSDGMGRGTFPENNLNASGSMGGKPPANTAILNAVGFQAQREAAMHVPYSGDGGDDDSGDGDGNAEPDADAGNVDDGE